MSKQLRKFEYETSRFLSDSVCHCIKKDLELLENISPEIVKIDINDINDIIKKDITDIEKPEKEVNDIQTTINYIKPEPKNIIEMLWDKKIDGDI